MTDSTRKSFENSLTIATNKLTTAKFPEQLETYRNELHRELAMQWPFRNDIPDSKSIAHTMTRDDNKSTLTFDDKDIPHSRSNNLTSINSTALIGKKSETLNRIVPPTVSQFSLDKHQQNIEWNLKAQEGIVTYQLPDGLPDGVALQTKLQKLMKTNTIFLNDRNFWTTLENRFKNLRKKNFQENMERLRKMQQQYEQELIAKGILPHTTEEAIRQYAEQQRTRMKPDKTITNNSNNKKCLIDSIPSNKNADANLLNRNEEFEAFETDNVHPRFHDIFTDYKFQTKLGKDIGEKFQDDLIKTQTRIKTIFPKTNQQDLIRQDLDVVKTSDGLYAYSNRLAKRILK
ncbi:unnamed protein product [Rotaria magnacalcarata]|uniref:Uncharacterized protein n=3 Tax=Rotaria magnacalcarata TaxID=392030 RepID=A0A816YMJ6_9BILA|nr:unnamed protein product [Rotaria magnacalcarata]